MTLEMLSQPATWISLVTLTVMEIVLGIDNIIFISILVSRVRDAERERTRRLGIGLALILRLGLLFTLTWMMGLTAPLFTLFSQPFSGRDLILLGGGLFLIYKSTSEMHEKLEGADGASDAPSSPAGKTTASASSVLVQILLIDIVFSLDSVITAVGMSQQLAVMVTAMLLSVGVMLVFAKAVGDFVERHPTVKMLALSFLLLIGVVLVADGLGQHIAKGYIYFAMAFSFGVEMLNLRIRKASQPVHLLHSGPQAAPDEKKG